MLRGAVMPFHRKLSCFNALHVVIRCQQMPDMRLLFAMSQVLTINHPFLLNA